MNATQLTPVKMAKRQPTWIMINGTTRTQSICSEWESAPSVSGAALMNHRATVWRIFAIFRPNFGFSWAFMLPIMSQKSAL
jgi:hypothetical protein